MGEEMEKPSMESPLLTGTKEEGELLKEVKKQLWLAGPLVAGCLLQKVIQMTSVMFVGHLGELSLSGASMASSFAGVTGFSLLAPDNMSAVEEGKMHAIFTLIARETVSMSSNLMNDNDRISSQKLLELKLFVLIHHSMQELTMLIQMGMGSALDTLCGQAYGAKQYYMLGIHMQRAMLVLMLVSIPLAIIWAFTGQLLLLCGQDLEIAMEAGVYARWMIPSLFAYGLLQCHVRFLQTQNIVFPAMLSSGIAAMLHIPICWILVYQLGLGSKGAALANGISYWINVLLLALYVKLSKNCKKTWTGFSKEALHDILNFTRLAIPSALMVCLEYWSFEFVVLLSGLLPNPKLETSVLSIILNTCSAVFMIPFGLGAAVSTRVSNELGAGRGQAARLAVSVVLFLAIAEGLVVGLALVLLRGIWGYAYSNEEEVVEYVAILLPILAASNIFDGLQCVLSGVARGCGWQKIGAFVNLGAFYIAGIPSAILLAFVFHLGGKGLWLGITCGILPQALIFLIITLRTDWEKEARKAEDRLFSSTISQT